ncbi:MAG: hypothetical protein WCE94_10545 [Candidatus Methanoperedens sp.]
MLDKKLAVVLLEKQLIGKVIAVIMPNAVATTASAQTIERR